MRQSGGDRRLKGTLRISSTSKGRNKDVRSGIFHWGWLASQMRLLTFNSSSPTTGGVTTSKLVGLGSHWSPKP
ncbi:hypothetical protein Pyn_16979 [Prunus yedoensis var. nudiflora]|uniref:Uncharacterized protein n=1 Tax=Prunus yedoensis var. nudiflora TaxID=2094558 RepID=A0A314ZBM1_PRUYE|nr:hypothetical protein Pyn_16979 [Prunus yedoensis var. nudiflora]